METAELKSSTVPGDAPPAPCGSEPEMSDEGLRALKARLATKLTKILDEIEPAPKTGHNKDQGYDYQSAKDIVSVTRKVMARNGVMLTWIPNPAITWREYQSRSNNLQREATIWYAATFTDAETGYEEVILWPGVGVDGNDKSLAKAATAAMKSFLATQFQIGDEGSENDRSEEDGCRSRGARAQQRNENVWPKKIGGVLQKTEPRDNGSYVTVKATRFWAPWDLSSKLVVASGRFIEIEADMGKGPDGPCPVVTKILAIPPGPLPKSVQEARSSAAVARSAGSEVVQGHPDAKPGEQAARTILAPHDTGSTRSETKAPTGQELFPPGKSGR